MIPLQALRRRFGSLLAILVVVIAHFVSSTVGARRAG
jgi:hypothetical protein